MTYSKRKEERVALRPKTLHAHISVYGYIMSMVATQLFFSFFLAAGRIHFIILNQAGAGQNLIAGRIWLAGLTLDMPA